MKPEEVIQTERRALETMSETSEGTAATSVSGQNFETREELLELAALLQLTDLDDLHRERFRVDRRKLEHMLLGDNEAPEPADTFFHKIMDETNTFVTWPSRLKIGAKSKKDPHIKVAGRLDDVRAAKEKIMQILDPRSMRVTMKLDVSYTDHSHIIGKGGLTIKRVMEETGCHIHFPDSNRSNHQEKSNQVSIAGEMEGVEKARARVRNLTPLIFSFELPIMGSMQSQPDSTSPYIVRIQEKYNVQVMFRTRPKLHATLVVVKGCEWEVPQVKEATLFLIHHMCKNLANQIQVQMSMEISPQHHSIVLGKQSNNLKLIMQRTSTQIMFPDAGDPNIPSLKKSNVLITGSIHNVYLARQQLVGSLPLVLMFDLPENSMQTIDTENISQLMQTLDVFINVRHKPKQSSFSVIIKGVERNASNIYEARRQLMNLDEPMIEAKLPLSLQIPNANNLFQGNSGNANSGNFMGLSDNLTNMLSINTQNQSPFCLSPLSISPNGLSLSPGWGLPQVPSMFSPLLHPSFTYNHANAQLLAATRAAMQSNILNQQAMNLTSQNSLGQNHPPGFHPNAYQNTNNGSVGSSSKSGSLVDNKEANYMSLSSASSTLSSPAISPRNVSPIGSADTSMNLGYNTSVLSNLSILDNKTERKNLDIGTSHLMPFDYEQKKLLAFKAMKNKPKSSEYRVPTAAWSGYGLSETMPASHTPTEINANEAKSSLTDSADLWDDPTTPLVYMGQVIDFDTDRKESVGMNSLYMDHTPRSKLNKIISGAHTDLTTTLSSVGLEKYIRTFSSHEIDMSTFLSLTDKDLTEIGITAWGARRKILLLISEMNKRTKPFSGSAAPGAERKSSLTNSTVTGNGNSVEGKW